MSQFANIADPSRIDNLPLEEQIRVREGQRARDFSRRCRDADGKLERAGQAIRFRAEWRQMLADKVQATDDLDALLFPEDCPEAFLEDLLNVLDPTPEPEPSLDSEDFEDD